MSDNMLYAIIVVIGAILFALVGFAEEKREHNEHELNIKAVESGYVQEVHGFEVIWVKPKE